MSETQGSYPYSAKTSTFLNHIPSVPDWRYRCPNTDCHSTAVVVRRQLGDPKQYSEHVDGAIFKRRPDVKQYRCDQCGETFDQPYDDKHGEQRHVAEVSCQ